MSKASKERRREARRLLFGPGAVPPVKAPAAPAAPANAPRAHEPKGTRVAVIREEHGWHDGRVTGTLIDDNGTVRVDDDDPYFAGSLFYCPKRRDYYVIR